MLEQHDAIKNPCQIQWLNCGFESHSLRQRAVRLCSPTSAKPLQIHSFSRYCVSPSFAAVRLYPQIICGSGCGYELGGHFDAGHRKTHRTEGRAGETARPLWRRRRALPADHRARLEVMDIPFLDCRARSDNGDVRDTSTKKVKGRSREMGLGSSNTVSLAEARDRAAECRKLREQEIDPIEARETAKRQAALERAKSLKFKEAAATYMAAHRVAWKNDKHAAQWTSTLRTYAYPLIGDISLQAIDTGLVMKVVEPIWATKPETANRVRGRIETILDWATVRGYRQGENPARWRGHLDKLLPSRSKVRKTQHHSALPYAELSAFLTCLRGQEGIAARALEFTILTASRTSEVIGARRSEFNRREKLWTVPARTHESGQGAPRTVAGSRS